MMINIWMFVFLPILCFGFNSVQETLNRVQIDEGNIIYLIFGIILYGHFPSLIFKKHKFGGTCIASCKFENKSAQRDILLDYRVASYQN